MLLDVRSRRDDAGLFSGTATLQQARPLQLACRWSQQSRYWFVTMLLIRELPAGQDLLLVTTFEPIPLYKVLERQGFAHGTKQVGPEEWHIRFSRTSAGA
jgi:uncharacterized protein (DUF2249 family)